MAQALTYRADLAEAGGAGIIARVRKALADYRLYAQTVRELEQLTDRDLADLGIHRLQIHGIARESVYGA